MKYNRLLRFLTVPLAVLFMVFALGAGNALAQSTIYVNVDTGDDVTGDGSQGSPYETIETAETNAASGDILSVAAGVYNEGGAQVDITKDLSIVVTDYDGSSILEVPNGLGVNSSVTLSLNDSPQINAPIVNQGTIDLSDAGGTFMGDLTNDGGTTQLGAQTLTLSDALTIDNSNSGAIISDNAGTIGNGNVLVQAGSGNTVDFANNGGELPNITVASGTLDLNGQTVTAYGSFTQSGGSVADAAGTLDLKGSFSRTGGTFDVTNGTLTFSGSANRTLAPGSALNLNNLTINKSGSATVTVMASFFAAGNVTVSAGNLDLQSYNLRLNNGAATIDVDGSYDASTGALIVDNGATTTLQGTGTYGNLTIGSSAGTAGQLGSNISLSGNLSLDGELDFGTGPFTLTLTEGNDVTPVITRTDNSTFTNGGGQIATAAGVEYNLMYEANAAVSASDEWVSGSLNNLTVSSTSTGATITGPGGSSSLGGALNVGAGETLDLGTGTLTLATNGSSHTVMGTVSNGTVDFDAANITVNGSSTASHASALNVVTVGAADAAISDIQTITGTVTVEVNSSLSLGLYDGGNANEGEVQGAISVNAGSDGLTLTSNVISTSGGVTINGGTLAFGENNLVLTGGAFSGASGVEYTGTGWLDLDGATGVGANGEAIANVKVSSGTVSLNSDLEVTTSFVGEGTALNGGQTLTLSGDADLDNTFAFGGGSTVEVTGTTITGMSDASFDNLTINSADTVTFATDDADNPRTFTVNTAFTHTQGAIELGDNHLALNEATYTYAEGTYSAGDGMLVLNDATSDDGLITFDTNDETVSIPNVAVQVAGGTAADASDGYQLTSNDELEITGMLDLDSGELDFATNADAGVSIADGVTITREQGTLNGSPSFAGRVSLVYEQAVTDGNEVPGDGELVNFTDNAGITVDQDLTASGTVTLDGATDTDANNAEINLEDDATLVLKDNVAFGNLTLTASDSYSLTYQYDTSPADISDSEFLSGATVDVLTVDLNDAADVLRLDKDRSANDVVLGNGVMRLDDNSDPFDLTINGNLTFDGGTLASNFATSHLSFEGSSNSWINVNDGGITGSNVEVHLNKDSDDLTATIAEGDLDLSSAMLHLESGMLATEDDVAVQLGDPGYERDVADTVTAHITGTVQKKTGTNPILMDFPTGSEDGKYRPATVTFTQDNPPITDSWISVNHHNTKPQGSSGFPISDGELSIEGWAPFYWAVSANPKLGVSQQFDLEFEAQEYEDEDAYDDVEDLRIIRRFEGDQDNEWKMQGGNYDNFEVNETTPVVRTIGSQGGLVNQTARFTIGIPTSGTLAPSFVTGPESIMLETIEGAEVDTTINFEAEPASDSDEIVKYSLEGAPDYVSIDSTNGDVTISMTASEADTLSSSFTVSAEDSNGRVGSTTVSLEVVIAVDIDEPVAALPKKFELDGNYPNPFNPTTNVQFDLPAQADVSIEVYNTLGQRVMMLPAQTMQAGAEKTVQIDASSLSSGMYLYRVIARSAEKQMVKGGKMMLMK